MRLCATLALAFTLAACADQSANQPSIVAVQPLPLQGAPVVKEKLFPSAWVASELVGVAVPAGDGLTLSFDAAGAVSGQGGCNNFAGTATLDGDRIAFTPLAATRKACLDEQVGAREMAYFGALERAERVKLTADGALELHGAGDVRPTRFVPAAGPAVITGSVTYRQRIALPPGSRLEVKVEDVSLADAPSETIAETSSVITGQVPVSFEIAVGAGKVKAGRMYTLRATIFLGDQMLFTTDTHVSVLGEGDPARVDLVLVQVAGR